MDFLTQIREAIDAKPMDKNPFVQAVQEGLYPREALALYAQRIVRLAKDFPNRIGAMIAICDDDTVRQHLVLNLLEEEGVVSHKRRVFDIEQKLRHVNMAERFLACFPEQYQTLPEDWHGRSGWFHKKIVEGQWLTAVAYMIAGMESNTPPTFSLLIPAFKKNYGFTTKDLIFFSEHVAADIVHGDRGVEILMETAKTPEQREQVLEGALAGARTWYLLHAGIHKDICKRWPIPCPAGA